MRNQATKDYIVDSLGLISIGIVSLGYVLFVRPFAELHLQFPFLDFPIFIGEILLFFCLYLFLLKNDFLGGEKNFWLIAYFAFVIFKALWGYWTLGPLAFRHAALFYYPVFAIFGYSFYRREFFNGKTAILLVFVILSLFADKAFDSYWVLTCFILAFILSYSYPDKIVRYTLLFILLLLTPYRLFFSTSRMMMVANFVTGVYLVAGLYFSLKVRKTVKVAAVVLGLFLVTWGLIRFSDKNALKTIVDIGKITAMFEDYDKQIEARLAKDKWNEQEEMCLKASYRQAQIVHDADQEVVKIQVYNPDPSFGLAFLRNHQSTNGKHKDAQILMPAAEVIVTANDPGELEKNESPVIGPDAAAAVTQTATFVTEQIVVSPSPETVMQETAFAAVTESPAVKDMEKAELKENNALTAVAQPPAVETETKKEQGQVREVQIYNPDPPFSFEQLRMKKSTPAEFSPSGKTGGTIEALNTIDRHFPQRNLEGAYINALFRLFIWRDMLVELIAEKPILGFHLGKPLRPKSLKALNWGTLEFFRDGWIEPHNSYLHMIYRAGIVGLLAVGAIFVILFRMIKKSIRCRSMTGVLLCGIIVSWFVAANFLLILELPYTAIPLWTLFGLTYAYLARLGGLPLAPVKENKDKS